MAERARDADGLALVRKNTAVPPGDVHMTEPTAGKRPSDRLPGEAEPGAKRSPTPVRTEEGARPEPAGHAFGGMD